jgi:hypothetical protein
MSYVRRKRIFLSWFVAALLAQSAARPAEAGCGDFNGDGALGASDALGVLQAAVSTRSCANVRCDVNGNGFITSGDALIVLRGAVGVTSQFSCPDVPISSIEELPRATAPVGGGVSLGSLVAGSALTTGGAETGISLATLGADSFSSNSSMAACEVSNMTLHALNEAAQGDVILCYIQSIFASESAPSVDIYDGAYHTFDLHFTGEPPLGEGEHGGPSRVRMRLVRDGDTITDFELAACRATDNGTVQDEYVKQSISGPDFTMLSKGREGGDAGRGREVTVRGSFGDDGGFVGRKRVSVAHKSVFEGGSGYGAMGFVQGADEFAIDGYDSGGLAGDLGSVSFTRQIHAEAELLDFNVPDTGYSLSRLAVGHGAAKARSAGSNAFGDWVFEDTQGWNGDTTEVDPFAAASFLETVLGAQLTPVGEPVDVVFGEDEAWDCGGEADAVLEIDRVAIEGACSDLRLSWAWVNCWEVVDPSPPSCEGPDCACEGVDCPPPPCEGPDCPCEGVDCPPPPCEGPDCPCEGVDCPPPPCEGPDCPCEGVDCPPLPCEGSDCPCEGVDCPPPPCEGPDCACEGVDCPLPPCEGPDCPCDGFDCPPPPCEGIDCPCEGPDCPIGCAGLECDPLCWDQTCDCNPLEAACIGECWLCETPTCDGPDCVAL